MAPMTTATIASVQNVNGASPCSRYIVCRTFLSVIVDVLSREELFDEAETAHVGHSLRIENAVEMVAFVLHDARVESLGDTVDGIALLVRARIAKLRVARHHAAHAGNREAALPSFLDVAGEERDLRVHEHGER